MQSIPIPILLMTLLLILIGLRIESTPTDNGIGYMLAIAGGFVGIVLPTIVMAVRAFWSRRTPSSKW